METESFTAIDPQKSSFTKFFTPSNLPSWPGSSPPSVAPAPSVAPSEISGVGRDQLAEALIAEMASKEGDALAFQHVEAFNILCVGESGLGKSTFLRDIFAHLDPTKQQEMKRRVAEQAAKVAELSDLIDRNEKESRQCDDKRALELRVEKKALRASREEAAAALEALRAEKREQEQAVADLRAECAELDETLRALRDQRDREQDDAEAERVGHEVLRRQAELTTKQEQLASELRRSNLDKEGAASAQTREVTARLIKGMPLFDGARQALDVTLIDTPGYGDLLVDTAPHCSADKVCAEVERRITLHLGKERASRPGMPLDDEKKFWNELVHLCLFFISPHRMKRADVDLMRRLHGLVPLVVVIAKSDTMTKAETLEYKETVRKQLRECVQTFAFDPRLIKEVETAHTAQAAEGFQPLYGGSDGQWPWAVMGSDESRREYIWGTAITNEPMHSEMPALRDLLLRAGGWEQLKREASLKADAEGLRRAEERRRRDGLRSPLALLRAARAPLAAAPRSLAWLALAVALAAALLPAAWPAARRQPAASTAGVPGARGGERLEWVHGSKVAALERALESAREDLAQCTEVRRALDHDFRVLQQKAKVKSDWW